MEADNITTDQKLDELETLLLNSLLNKAREGEPLSSVEMTLVTKWLLSRKGIKKGSNSPVEPLVTQGQPLPFLKTRMTLEEAQESLEDM